MPKIMAKPKILTKRLLLIVILLVLMLVLTGCSSNSSEIIDPKFGNLIIITSKKGDDSAPSGDYSYLEYLAYGPETKAVYMVMTGYRRFGITPYLVPNESGGLEYAIYGQNYPIK